MNLEAVDERICPLRIRGKFNNFTIISVHTPVAEKGSFNDERNQIYQRIPAHDTTVIVGDFNTKIGREVFKPVTGKWSMRETLNENGIRAMDFATNNNMIIRSTYFLH
jgi:endonuclease/exonuclease/phosphatase family metal-dependent hydrolase